MNTPLPEIDRIFNLQTNAENLQKLKNTTAKERIAAIRKIERYLLDKTNRKKFTEALFTDLRKPAEESLANELVPTLMTITHVIKNLKTWVRDEPVDSPVTMTGMKSYIRYEPKGCVLVISPWNYPFQLSMNPMIYAIASGNAVIIKPSEFAVATSAFIKEMVYALFSENEVAVFEGDAATSTLLLNKPFHHIFFTGSPAVGKIVMEAASRNLTSVTLELGGKSPVIVDETYNIKTAAEKIVWAKTMNCGQTCVAPDYLLIHESKKEEFIQAYRESLNKFYNSDGKGILHSRLLARIINGKNLIRVKALLDDAVTKGAQIAVGGEIIEEELYIEPTILDNVHHGMDIMKEEIFAPVLPVLTFKSIADAADKINLLPKPLTLYVLSKSNKNIEHLLNNSSAGNSMVNELMLNTVNPNLPFGGVNNSGTGKSNGKYSFIEFSNQRGIIRRNWGTLKMIYPPYNKTIINWLVKLARI